MKLKNLLILGAMLLSVGSVSAKIENGVRVTPVTSELQWNTEMYLMNVEADRFFAGDNDWGTQASATHRGWKVKVSKHIDAATGTWDEKTVTIKDSIEHGNYSKQWRYVWFVTDANNSTLYTDANGHADTLLAFQKVGDYYRLSASSLNPNSKVQGYASLFVGVNFGEDHNSRLKADLDETAAGNMVDWAFVTPQDYEVYLEAKVLKNLLDVAEAKGVDVSAQKAVYTNEASTIGQINEAIVAVDALLESATLEASIDFTSMITNPSYGNNEWSGWSGSRPGFQRFTNAEFYNTEFEHGQLVEGLPNGFYKMSVQGFYRPSGNTWAAYQEGKLQDAKFFVANGADSLNIPMPNHFAGGDDEAATLPNNMETAANFFAEGKYQTEVYFTVENHIARIGLKLGKKIGGTDWVIWDNWKFTYYGNATNSYAIAVTERVNSVLTKFDATEAKMTVGTVDAYKTALTGLTASDSATFEAALATVNEAIADVETNINGWKEYEALIAKANEVRGDPSYSPSTAMTTMAGYAMRQAPAILKALALPTEELLAEVKKLNDMIETAIRESLKVDSEVTSMFLVNPNYEEGTKGWSGKWGAVAGPADNKCMEAYAMEWDAYQIVKDAPQGVYEVSLQGFYRVERGTKAWELYVNGGQICPGGVYVNNKSTPVKCVFDEALSSKNNIYSGTTKDNGAEGDFCRMWDEAKQDSTVTPNTMTTAGEAFKAGMYVSSANGIVAQKGDELRLGVKGKQQSATWVIWDNFKMVYRGKQLKYTMPYLQEAIAAAGENLKKPMDKDTKVIVETAKANAEALLGSTDENAVFDALVALYESNDSVEAASAIFDDLTKAAVSIEEAIMANSETATMEAQLNAQNLLNAISNGLNEASLTKAEAKALLAQVEKVLMDLRVPDVTNASDETPVKFTQLLMTPNFDKDGANSTEGGTGATGGYGNGDEAKALIYEFYNRTFNIYQELKNIPNGTYRIEVSAFNRHGSSVNDYFSYQANPDTSSAYVYGMDCTGDSLIYKQPIARLTKYASLDYFSAYDFDSAYFARVDTLKNVEMGADSVVWVVNVPRGASLEFDDMERYTNTVYVEVTNGTLRLGMEKTEVAKGDTKVTWDGRGMKHGDDWVTMDNWKLYYHGTASKFKPTSVGEVFVAAPSAPVKVEVYNLNGVRLNKLQKGVNIIRTIHADGQVTVKKRLVK